MTDEDIYYIWNILKEFIQSKDREEASLAMLEYVYNNDGCVASIRDAAQEEDDEFIVNLIDKYQEDLLDAYDDGYEEDW